MGHELEARASWGNIKMKKKVNIFGLFIVFTIILVITFVPFPNTNSNIEGKYQYCRYRLSVYRFWYIESEGEGYDNSDSDTYIGSIVLEKKIGGPLEYFGLRKIKYDTVKKEEYGNQ